MQMIADLHTHTLCATHAYNTFTEMAAAAKEIGYCALAVTDHAPAMPDSPHAWHFQNWSAMPREIGGVVMLYGAVLTAPCPLTIATHNKNPATR